MLRLKLLLPVDPGMLDNIHGIFEAMDSDTFEEVDQVAGDVARYGADRDAYVAVLNDRYEVICCEVPTGHWLVFARDKNSGQHMLVQVRNHPIEHGDAAALCAKALGIVVRTMS